MLLDFVSISVPMEYWGDCVLTTVFLINRLPTPLLQDKSQFDVLTSHRPDYQGLRVFGCLAYNSTLSKHKHKFQPRARPCVFLEYHAGYKATNYWILRVIRPHLTKCGVL